MRVSTEPEQKSQLASATSLGGIEELRVGSGRAPGLIVEELDQGHQGHECWLAAPIQKSSDCRRVQSSLATHHPWRHVFGVHCIAQPAAKVPLDDPGRYPNVIHSTPNDMGARPSDASGNTRAWIRNLGSGCSLVMLELPCGRRRPAAQEIATTRKPAAQFVGLWAPTILSLGLFTKLLGR
jgi:hypothetical protein